MCLRTAAFEKTPATCAAVFRAMGDEMPEEFAVRYLYDWKPDPPLT